MDDHPILREGISQLISREDDMEVCGEAEDATGALKVAQETNPDVALVDISLKDSNGIDLIRDMLARWPKMPILVLSMHSEAFYAERVFKLGARGYLTKGEPGTKVIEGLRKVLNGDSYVSEQIATRMVDKMIGGRQGSSFPIDRLSDREFQVFHMIGQGIQSREIAEKLHLSVKTVDTHRENIKTKLKIKDATELLKTAIQWTQFDQGTGRFPSESSKA